MTTTSLRGQIRCLRVDGGAQRGQRLLQSCHLAPAVHGPAVPPVAVGGHEQDGLELSEAGGGTLPAVVLTAGRPDRADAGGGQEGDQGRGGVGQVADDPVPGPHPGLAQPAGERGDLRAQLRPRRAGGGAVLADRGDRHFVGPLGNSTGIGDSQLTMRLLQPCALKERVRRDPQGFAESEFHSADGDSAVAR